MYALLLTTLGGLILTLGDLVFKEWIEKGALYTSVYYGLGMLLYIAGLVLLVESFKSEHIAVASAIFMLANIATLAMVSWVRFGEILSPLQILGLVLAGVSLVLLEWGSIHG